MATGRKTGGRQRGTPNRSTASAKAALQEAFEGMGGVAALTDWGKENRTEFYKLYGRLIPSEIAVQEPVDPAIFYEPQDLEALQRYANREVKLSERSETGRGVEGSRHNAVQRRAILPRQQSSSPARKTSINL